MTTTAQVRSEGRLDNVSTSLDSTTGLPAADKSTGQAKHVNVKTIVLLSGERPTPNVMAVEQQFNYKVVAASQTALALGTKVVGDATAIGDFLHSIIITASVGTITILDNAVSVAVIPAGALGVFIINLQSVSGAWNITTAAATSCTAVGRFG